MKQIPLTQGKYTIVDDEDYDFLNQWKWQYDHGYALRSQFVAYLGRVNHVSKVKYNKIYMHRLIMNTPKGKDTDHINRDRLDNRRCNLRIATSLQNALNKGITKRNKSGVTGVIWHKAGKKWMAFIIVNYKQIYLGLHRTIEDAVKARESAILKYRPQLLP